MRQWEDDRGRAEGAFRRLVRSSSKGVNSPGGETDFQQQIESERAQQVATMKAAENTMAAYHQRIIGGLLASNARKTMESKRLDAEHRAAQRQIEGQATLLEALQREVQSRE